MRSKTSFYNKAFSLSLLRRFWPLWLLWLALLLLVAVLGPAGNPPEAYGSPELYVQELNRVLLDTGVAMVYCAAAAGPIMAMAMLGYLYNPKSCNMVAALPMRREEAYFTAVLTGLVPMLLADVLTWLLILARFGGIEGVMVGHIHQWLGLVVMGNIAFCGMACFCGVLTGNTVVLPLVYVVLGFTAVAVESTARGLLGVLVRGYTWGGLSFDWLAPLEACFARLQVVGDFVMPTLPGSEAAHVERDIVYHVKGVPYLAGLCAAGIVLILLGALILRKRHMETAGDVVAVPILKPIFRVCMAVGTGLVFSAAFCDGYFRQLMGGRALAAVAFLLLILGAALGYFIAEMLIRKTLRVFDRGWKQLAVICACLVLPFLLAELDVTGYEKRVPDPDEVEAVRMGYDDSRLTGAETIAAYCDLHRGIVSHKAVDDGPENGRNTVMIFRYELKNGKMLERLYHIPNDERAQADPDSDIAAYQAFLNLPEPLLKRVGADREISAETIRCASLDISRPDAIPERGWTTESLRLTPEEAAELYEQGVLPDAREGNIERWYAWESEAMRAETTDMTLSIELFPEEEELRPDAYRYYNPGDHLDLNVLTCSAHTIRWLERNLGVAPVSRTLAEEAAPAAVRK